MRSLKVLGEMGYAYDYAERPLDALWGLEISGLAEIVDETKTRHGVSRKWALTERGIVEYRQLLKAGRQKPKANEGAEA